MEIVIIVALLLLNGVFAMYEIALVSSSRARLELLAGRGNHKASKVLQLLDEPEKILSTIQVGITLIGIVSGAYGGLALAGDLTPYLEKIESIRPYAHNVAVISVVGLITYFSLIIGELVPKSLALSNPERISMALTPTMVLLTRIGYPFVWFLSFSTKFVNRLLGLKSVEERAMTEDELKYLLTYSSQQGVIEQKETQMIKDVFRFTDKKAGELMTHRGEVIALPQDATREDVLKAVSDKHFSRYPLYADSMEEIVGIVAVKDMLTLFNDTQNPFNLVSIATVPLFIPENMLANKILEMFREHKTNFGIVVSEYGLIEGIITLHDLTESILGDIPEEDEQDNTIVMRHDGTFLVDGSMSIDDFMDAFGITVYDDVKDKGYATLSGMAMHILRNIPTEGDTFEYKNLLFEIVDMDNSRVDKLLVSNKIEK